MRSWPNTAPNDLVHATSYALTQTLFSTLEGALLCGWPNDERAWGSSDAGEEVVRAASYQP